MVSRTLTVVTVVFIFVERGISFHFEQWYASVSIAGWKSDLLKDFGSTKKYRDMLNKFLMVDHLDFRMLLPTRAIAFEIHSYNHIYDMICVGILEIFIL